MKLPALVLCMFLSTTMALSGQVDILTERNDNARSGANLQEATLNASNVNTAHFGKLATRTVDGDIYAQPLIVSEAKAQGRATPTNLLIVATEHNSVYAFDADDTSPHSTTAEVWHVDERQLGTHVEATDLYKDIGTPGCVDLTTEVGITGTPAIGLTRAVSPKEGIIYVAAKSVSEGTYRYNLFALSLADGSALSATTIAGAVKGIGGGSQDSTIAFQAEYELNRPALLLDGNVLYIAFGGHCDHGPYHGWVFAYDTTNPKAPKLIDVFCSTPNGTGSLHEGRAGIWMSGQGPAADGDGNVYLLTGDGTYNGTTDYGDSVVKLRIDEGRLRVRDWFTPQDQETLKNDDVDLGSAGAALLPGSHLLIAGSKEGRIYLLDRGNLGKDGGVSLDSFQVTHTPSPATNVYYNIHGTPAIWTRAGEIFVYVNGEEDPLKQYRLIPDAAAGWKFESATPYKTSRESAPYPNAPAGYFGEPNRVPVWMPGGFVSVSANGGRDGTGVVWVNLPLAENANHNVVRGVLRAFDAEDISKGELWDSETTGNDTDRLGRFAKFCPPTIANGKVYVATFQEEMVGSDGHRHKAPPPADQAGVVIYGLR